MLTFVGFQVVLFVALTWLALGVRTGCGTRPTGGAFRCCCSSSRFFTASRCCSPCISRSTVACVFGSVLFWLLAWGINYGYVMARGVLETQYLPAGTLALAKVGYWIFPKPIDAGLILFNALGALGDFDKPAMFTLLESGQRIFAVHVDLLFTVADGGAAGCLHLRVQRDGLLSRAAISPGQPRFSLHRTRLAVLDDKRRLGQATAPGVRTCSTIWKSLRQISGVTVHRT